MCGKRLKESDIHSMEIYHLYCLDKHQILLHFSLLIIQMDFDSLALYHTSPTFTDPENEAF